MRCVKRKVKRFESGLFLVSVNDQQINGKNFWREHLSIPIKAQAEFETIKYGAISGTK